MTDDCTARSRSDDRTINLATDINERMHHLDDATYGPPDLTQPATVATIANELAAAAHCLDHLLDQAQSFLARELNADRLRHAHGLDPAPTVYLALDQLGDAQAAAIRLGIALAHTHTALSPIRAPQTPAQLANRAYPTTTPDLTRADDPQPDSAAPQPRTPKHDRRR